MWPKLSSVKKCVPINGINIFCTIFLTTLSAIIKFVCRRETRMISKILLGNQFVIFHLLMKSFDFIVQLTWKSFLMQSNLIKIWSGNHIMRWLTFFSNYQHRDFICRQFYLWIFDYTLLALDFSKSIISMIHFHFEWNGK